MIKFIVVLMISSVILAFGANESNNKVLSHFINRDDCDSVTSKNLFSHAIRGIICMDSIRILSTEQAIMLIKTYNTLFIDKIARTADEECIYNYYKTKFKERFLSKNRFDLTNNSTELGLTIGKGFSLYSSKYDLYIGNGTIVRCKDIYIVTN